VIFLFAVTGLSLASITRTPSAPERQQTEILFLSFSDPALPDITAMIEQAQTQILEGRSTPVHFSFEYLDPSATESFEQQRLVSFLREKYQGHQFRLLVAIGMEALTLAEELRAKAKMFSSAALVFAVVDPSDPKKLSNLKAAKTGVIRSSNFVATLQTALAQNPGTRHVIVISGSSELEKQEVSRARDQFRAFESNVDFQYLADLKFAEVGPHLANLGPHTLVLFLNFLSDGTGEQFVPAQILPTLAGTANRPMYGTYASFVGKGVVGGSVADLQEVGKVLGQYGLRILNGEKPEKIPVAKGEFQRYIFDWRQLQRWNIPRDLVPPESSVLYWESSLWDLYGWRIVGLIAAVIIETLLIILLLQIHASRRRVEETLRQKQDELSEAQRIAQLGSWQWDPESDALTCSSTLYTLIGLDPTLPTLRFRTQSEFFSPDSWEQLSQSAEKALQTGVPYDLELEGSRRDGTKVWVSARGEAVRGTDGRICKLRGTMEEITERKKAEEVRSMHAAIVESSQDAIISQNSDGIILTWNLAAQRILGFSEAEMVGRSIMMLVPAHLHEEEQAVFHSVREGERIERYETDRLTKAGKLVALALTISPIRDSFGRIVGFSEIGRDITERKQAEEELRKSEEKFSKAFRHSPLAITLTGAKTHRYLDVNETYERLTGFRRDEVLGRSELDLGLWVNPGDRKELARNLLMGGSIRDVECRFRSKAGKILVGLASAELIEIQGEPCILGVVEDITDRVQTQQALVESERRFRLMADSAPVLMWMAGTDKLCTDFNKEWLRFTGRTMAQELGVGWTECVHPEDRERCLTAYNLAFDGRRQFTIEYRLRRHDGQYRSILDRGVPRFLEDGSFAGYVGCCIDISDEKEAKIIQRELGGRLMHAQEEERARIARELHDDINQRLALLANGLQSLEQASLETSESGSGKQVRELWQLTSEIANDIQHLSHQLHPSKLHYLGLPAAVRDLCNEFSKLHKIEVECIVQQPRPKLDETVSLTLYRVIQESLRNVVKHSGARHVKVELNGRSTLVRLRVSDDGIGFNVDHKGSRQGLGFVSMRERLRLAGGELSIWSRPSLGTQIEAVIPLAAERARSA
jgi:PAS domain S-box-containing protein